MRGLCGSFLATTVISALLLCPLALLHALKFRAAEEAKGVVLLDAITFPKLVPSPTHYVVVQVTNKHSLGDYGTDSIRSDFFSFAQFAQSQGDSREILFAQVIVNGAENRELARNLQLADDFKFPRMYVYGINNSVPFVYPEEKSYRAHDLTRFLSQYTSFYYAVPGTSKSFDKLAKKFVKAQSVEERAALLEETKEQFEKIRDAQDKDDMRNYVKVMEKIIEKGEEYIKTELARILKVLDNTQLSKTKQARLRSNYTVVRFFEILLDNEKASQRLKEEAQRRKEEAELAAANATATAESTVGNNTASNEVVADTADISAHLDPATESDSDTSVAESATGEAVVVDDSSAANSDAPQHETVVEAEQVEQSMEPVHSGDL